MNAEVFPCQFAVQGQRVGKGQVRRRDVLSVYLQVSANTFGWGRLNVYQTWKRMIVRQSARPSAMTMTNKKQYEQQ